MRLTKSTISLVIMLAASVHSAFATTVENVQAMQRPGTGLVDVYYDLVAPEGGSYVVSVQIASDKSAPPTTSMTGDVGVDVKPGRNNHIVWDASKDWPGNVDSNMVAIVATRTTTIRSEMAWIPPGINEGSDPLWGAYALTNSTGFWMDRTEVTFKKWMVVYEWALANGYEFSGKPLGKDEHDNLHSSDWFGQDFEAWFSGSPGSSPYATYATEQRITCIEYSPGGQPEVENWVHVFFSGLPVSNVSPSDARIWCNARSEMEGLRPCYLSGKTIDGTARIVPDSASRLPCGYRLPTKTEWMYAARGGLHDKVFPWGNTIDHSKANFCGRSGYWGMDLTTYVKSSGMHPKNVYEYLCEDPWKISEEARLHPLVHTTYDFRDLRYSEYIDKTEYTNAVIKRAHELGYRDVGVHPCQFSRPNDVEKSRNFSGMPVGSFPPNGYGLYDMAGNVAELFADGWILGGSFGTCLACSVNGGESQETIEHIGHQWYIEDIFDRPGIRCILPLE